MAKPRRRHPRRTKVRDPDKKKKTGLIVIGALMIGLMVFSVVGYTQLGNTNGQRMKYGDYKFTLEPTKGGGQVLVTEINGIPVEFQNLPDQVQYFGFDSAVTTYLKNSQQIVLVADPTLDVYVAGLVDYARLQISLAIPKTFNGMSVPDERYQLPVFNCSQANPAMPIIVFNVTNETTRMSSDGYCVTLSATNAELLRLKDRLIFEYYDIMDEI